MSRDRIEFEASNLEQLHELIDEGVQECTENFEDKRFDKNAPRKLTVEISFEPEKEDPSQVRVIFKKRLKLPPRLGKLALAAIRNHRMVLDVVPEQESIFDEPGETERKVRSLRPGGNE